MSRPTIFAQVRRGANPAHNLPDNYRSPERSGVKWYERSSSDAPLVELTSALLSCRVTPTDRLNGEWREFVCPQYHDAAHTTRAARIGPNGRETENREWEHRVLVLEKDWQRLLAKVEAAKNPQAHKPNASEKFFQPRRVQVAHYFVSRYNHSCDARYAVIVRDMTTRVTMESLHQGGEWKSIIGAEAEHIPGEAFTSKTAALDAAKRAALERQLAFDARLDLVEWKDIFLGPAQRCAACGAETDQRGGDAVVCPDCQVTLDLGRHARAECVAVEIPLEGVMPWGCLPTYLREDAGGRESRDEVEQQLLAELLGLCGVRFDPENAPHLVDPKFQLLPMGRQPSFSSRQTGRVLMTQEHFERLARALEIMGLLLNTASAYGHANGSSLLRSLAQGSVTADEFDERVAARAKEMQTRANRRQEAT